MPITVVNPINNLLWHKLVQCHRYASVFHTQEWLRALMHTYQFDIRAVIKTNSAGQPVAGIPYCMLNDHRGKRIVSMPFSDFSDALVQSLDEWCELVEPLFDENCPIVTRPLHNTIPLRDQRFELSDRAKWHGIDLQPDLDTLWNSLHDSARRAIRKSQREGVRVRIAEPDELRKFFNLHLGVRKYKYHLLAQPYAFFEHIWNNFIDTGQGVIFLADIDDTVIGSLFFLGYKDVFTYKFSATNQNELAYRPTDILLWEAMQYGKAQGFKLLDLGLSDWDQEGLLRFKRKYASEEKTISFLRYTPPNYVAPLDGLGTTLSRLTDLFTRTDVPDEVTEEAGNLLYRFFT
jgi:CelD/BcsL family acetyltransferase involved in cellulose biosynthesis